MFLSIKNFPVIYKYFIIWLKFTWPFLHSMTFRLFTVFLIFFLIFLMFIFESEREHEWGRGRERGRHGIQNRLQALSCQHRAWGRAQTHKLQDHDLSRSGTLNWLSLPGASQQGFSLKVHKQQGWASVHIPSPLYIFSYMFLLLFLLLPNVYSIIPFLISWKYEKILFI